MINIDTSANSVPLKYNTQAYHQSNVPLTDNKFNFADTFLSFLTPGDQAGADWKRQEQSAENAYLRELYSDSTKYQRAVEDARKAGLNPQALFGNASATVSGTSGGANSAGGTSGGSSMVKDLLKIGADIGIAIATKGKSTTFEHVSKQAYFK